MKTLSWSNKNVGLVYYFKRRKHQFMVSVAVYLRQFTKTPTFCTSSCFYGVVFLCRLAIL